MSKTNAYTSYITNDVEREVAIAAGFSIMSFPVEGGEPRRQMITASGAARPASEAENLMYKTLVTKETFIRTLARNLNIARAAFDAAEAEVNRLKESLAEADSEVERLKEVVANWEKSQEAVEELRADDKVVKER